MVAICSPWTELHSNFELQKYSSYGLLLQRDSSIKSPGRGHMANYKSVIIEQGYSLVCISCILEIQYMFDCVPGLVMRALKMAGNSFFVE